MPKYLRTCQMSVHGYPADMSIFLQLATRLTEVTRRHAPSRHRSRQCISCWRSARCSCHRVGRAVWCPRFLARRCWAIIRGYDPRWDSACSGDPVFPILQGLVDADFAAVEIGFYAQCWSCFSELDVAWSEPLLFIYIQWQLNYMNHKLELTSHCLAVDTLWHFLLYGLHLQRTPQ